MATKTNKQITYGIALAAVIVLVILAVIFHTNIRNQLNDWKLLPEPEKLTELYFTHPNSLPSTYAAGGTQTVAFTVHNLEYQTENYQYQITETSNNGQQNQILFSSSFVLKQNQYKNVSEPVSLLDFGSRVKISIDLTNVNETIDYWVTGSS